jgi:hypothetical protein
MLPSLKSGHATKESAAGRVGTCRLMVVLNAGLSLEHAPMPYDDDPLPE